MVERVSDIAAFVFAHGDEAEEIVFGEEDIGVLSAEENDAIDRAHAHTLDTIEAILVATRDAFAEKVKGHACAKNLKRGRTRRSTMRKNRSVGMPLVLGDASASITMATWGRATMGIHIGMWTHARHVQAVERAVKNAHLDLQVWQNDAGNHFVTAPVPVAGESIDDVAERVGSIMAQLARPIVDAVLANKKEK